MNSKTKTNKVEALKPIIKIDLPKLEPTDETRAQLVARKSIILCVSYKTARVLRARLAAVALWDHRDKIGEEIAALRKIVDLYTGTGDDGSPSDRTHAQIHRFDQDFYNLSVDLAFDLYDDLSEVTQKTDDKIAKELRVLLEQQLSVHIRARPSRQDRLAEIVRLNNEVKADRTTAKTIKADDPNVTSARVIRKRVKSASVGTTQTKNIIDDLQREIVERPSKTKTTAKQRADERKRAKLQGKSAKKASASNG